MFRRRYVYILWESLIIVKSLMTFSPEDAYANNVPVPDEDQFDTGGLELEPLGGG